MKDRHQCEVRHVLALRAKNRQAAIDYMELVTKKRGTEAGKLLQSDVMTQWSLGNRGEWDRWEKAMKEAA